MKRVLSTEAICLASLCLAGSACSPEPVGLVLTVEDAANLPPTTQSLLVSFTVNGVRYKDENFTVPQQDPYPHRYGIRLPDNASGEVKITVQPLSGGSSSSKISACGSEYKWESAAALKSGINEYKIIFTRPEGKYSNKNDLFASWSRQYFWAVGAAGTVIQYDGTCWKREQSPLLKPEYTFKAIWGLNDNEDPGGQNDVWVVGETNSGGSPQSVLLRRHQGVWSERGSLQGAVTAMGGLDALSDDGSKLWILGKDGTTPFLYYHEKKADNYVISKAQNTAYFDLAFNESIGDLTAMHALGDNIFIAAKVNRANSTPYLTLFRYDPVLNPPFRKATGTAIMNPLPLSIDSISVLDANVIWLAGPNLSPMPGANNKVTIRRLEAGGATDYQYTTFPDPMLFETSKVRMLAGEVDVMYLAKTDDSATPRPIEQPIVRCEYSTGTATGTCASLSGQNGRFPGVITSGWRGNEGALFYTLSGGGLARIDTKKSDAIETFVAP